MICVVYDDDLYSFQVRLVLSDKNSASQPFAVTTSTTLDSFALCDNEPHTISFKITATGIEFTVDGSMRTSLYPTQFKFSPMANVPIYLGGKPAGK